jgi:SAM-dependent methyltransferase
MVDAVTTEQRFYTEFARWWPLLSPVVEYAEEAAEFVRVLKSAAPGARQVLELGSGGGHNAAYLKQHYQLTLSDLSEGMLDNSRRLNPECEHVQGDMRNLRLGQSFDAVFVHDAVDYMCSEAELAEVIATAYAHCKPGGVALFVPDATHDSFEPDTSCGGSDGPEGEAARYLAWSYDPDPADGRVTTQYAFVFRERDGSVTHATETHESGLFSADTWLALLAAQGFLAELWIERTDEDRTPRQMFLGRRVEAARCP